VLVCSVGMSLCVSQASSLSDLIRLIWLLKNLTEEVKCIVPYRIMLNMTDSTDSLYWE